MTTPFKKWALLLLTLPLAFATHADEGMWLPVWMKKFNEARMKQLGCELTAEQIFSNDQASLKDAVVLFGGGCTGEVVGQNSLILTNHHCGLDWIQQLSSPKRDFVKYGYWAQNPTQEIPCPGLQVSFLVYMRDVTPRVVGLLPQGISEAERQKLIAAEIQKIETEATTGNHFKAQVKPMFYGAEYYLMVYETFTDIRFVGAPPISIGNFGGDTDNWSWPRHTGDFSLFRVYAGADNKPAAFNVNNKPFKPRAQLTLNIQGIKPGDFTMVYGFPGRTQQYLSSYAMQLIKDSVNTKNIEIRRKRLDLIEAFSAKDSVVKLQYTSKRNSLANYWKKWSGENQGLYRTNALSKKLDLEQRFTTWAGQQGGVYPTLLPELKKLYGNIAGLVPGIDLHREALIATEVISFSSSFRGLYEEIKANPKAEQYKGATAVKAAAIRFFRDYHEPLDRQMAMANWSFYSQKVPMGIQSTYFKELGNKYKGDWTKAVNEAYDKTSFTNPEKLAKLIAKLEKGKISDLERDPIFAMWLACQTHYEKNILPPYQQLAQQVELLNRQYVEGQRKMMEAKAFYPDANSTLRITYGKVGGYEPRDGVVYHWQTTTDGILAKEDRSNPDFEVPATLKELIQANNFGIWKGKETQMPVAFVASNHTTGGNSGSPVLNAKGQLIGINFDRVWEGTMSDINYDPSICRNITCDIRYVLFVIDKVGGASWLLEEMRFEK